MGMPRAWWFQADGVSLGATLSRCRRHESASMGSLTQRRQERGGWGRTRESRAQSRGPNVAAPRQAWHRSSAGAGGAAVLGGGLGGMSYSLRGGLGESRQERGGVD